MSACLILGSSVAAFAQEKEKKAEFTLDEIVITAERQETSAADTPIAVTAFSSSVLDDEAIYGQQDLEMRMPSTFFGGNKIYIRGVGRELNQLGTDPGVAIYTDGFYSTEGVGTNDLFDLERLEAVRGPQGTLYGRNATGGAINIIPKKPTKNFEGRFRAQFGSGNYRSFHGAVGGPIYKDKLLVRVTLQDWYFSGLQKNVATGEYLGGLDYDNVVVKFIYQPVDDFSIYTTFFHMDMFGTSAWGCV